MSTTYTRIVTYRLQWTEEVPVEIPEGADEVDIDNLRRDAEFGHQAVPDGCDPDIVRSFWKRAPVPAPARPDEPPPGAWHEVRGAKWATDGHNILRQGGPLPLREVGCQWYTYDPGISAILDGVLVGPVLQVPPHGLLVPGEGHRCGPLLASAEERRYRPTFVELYRGGELFALVSYLAPEATP